MESSECNGGERAQVLKETMTERGKKKLVESAAEAEEKNPSGQQRGKLCRKVHLEIFSYVDSFVS